MGKNVSSLLSIFDEKTIRITLNQSGFNMFTSDTSYYVITSVLCFLKYLKEHYSEDETAMVRLANSAGYCGKVFLEGMVSVSNQSQLALYSAKYAYK